MNSNSQIQPLNPWKITLIIVIHYCGAVVNKTNSDIFIYLAFKSHSLKKNKQDPTWEEISNAVFFELMKISYMRQFKDLVIFFSYIKSLLLISHKHF